MNTQFQSLVYKASSKEYLHALIRNPSYLKKLDPGNKPYRSVVEWLLHNETAFADEDSPLPTMKEVAKKSGCEYLKTAKHLKDIYDDLLELNALKPELFCDPGQQLCVLYFNYFQHLGQFTIGLDQCGFPSMNTRCQWMTNWG